MPKEKLGFFRKLIREIIKNISTIGIGQPKSKNLWRLLKYPESWAWVRPRNTAFKVKVIMIWGPGSFGSGSLFQLSHLCNILIHVFFYIIFPSCFILLKCLHFPFPLMFINCIIYLQLCMRTVKKKSQIIQIYNKWNV